MQGESTYEWFGLPNMSPGLNTQDPKILYVHLNCGSLLYFFFSDSQNMGPCLNTEDPKITYVRFLSVG